MEGERDSDTIHNLSIQTNTEEPRKINLGDYKSEKETSPFRIEHN